MDKPRYWYEILVLYLKVGRIRNLQRVAALYGALEPPSPLTHKEVEVKHGRVYVPNLFTRAVIHNCMLGIHLKTFTIKRVITSLASGDLTSIATESLPPDTPLVAFLLLVVYLHLVQARGEVVVEIEEALQSVKILSFPEENFPLSPAQLVDIILERRLRFIESPTPTSPSSSTCCAVYLNEVLEQVFLDRWVALKGVKSVFKRFVA